MQQEDEVMNLVFIDRDGTLGGDGGYCNPDDFTLYPESIDAIRRLKESNLKAIVITNQSHIASGDITLEQMNQSFERIQRDLQSNGASLDGWYICPHGPDDNCTCRKPGTALLQMASQDFDVPLEQCWVIGDREGDLIAGAVAGCKSIMVLTGRGKRSLDERQFRTNRIEPACIAKDILEAVEFIISTCK